LPGEQRDLDDVEMRMERPLLHRRREVDGAGDGVRQFDRLDGGYDLLLVVDVLDPLEDVVRKLEQDVVLLRDLPLDALLGLEVVGLLLRGSLL